MHGLFRQGVKCVGKSTYYNTNNNNNDDDYNVLCTPPFWLYFDIHLCPMIVVIAIMGLVETIRQMIE